MDIGIEHAHTKKGISFSKATKVVIIFVMIGLVVFLSIVASVQFKYKDKLVEFEDIQPPNIALVFGAGLKAKGEPSAVLEDRILTAIGLYQDGKVGKIIMSGDNRNVNHNEVLAMKNFALQQGLDEADTVKLIQEVNPLLNEDLAKKIEQLYQNRELGNELSINGYEKIKDKFDKEKQMKKMYEVMNEN